MTGVTPRNPGPRPVYADFPASVEILSSPPHPLRKSQLLIQKQFHAKIPA